MMDLKISDYKNTMYKTICNNQRKTSIGISPLLSNSILTSTSTSFKKTQFQFKNTFNKERKDIISNESNGFSLKKVKSADEVGPFILLNANKIKTNTFNKNSKEILVNSSTKFLNDVKNDLSKSRIISSHNLKSKYKVGTIYNDAYMANPKENIYKYFHDPNFIDDLKRRDPFFADKLIRLKKYSFKFKKITEKMVKDVKKYSIQLDREYKLDQRKSQETRDFINSTGNLQMLKRFNFQAIKRAGMKINDKEEKMLKFRIPGKDHILEKQISLDKLLSPQLKKIIKIKFQKEEENDFRIYQTKRIKSLSYPRVVFNKSKSSLYNEMMKTCNIANDESEFTLSKLVITKKKDFEQEKNDNLCKIDKILKKKFYIK